MVKSVAIFASGSGSNAENIIHLLHPEKLRVAKIYTNKSSAGVIERAKRLDIPFRVFNASIENEDILQELLDLQIDAIVLAGYLHKIPESWIQAFPQNIINIHPSLLPKYGGKGMYGNFVHQAVLENQESETGITIHRVNAEYDKGEILFQKSISIVGLKTAHEIAEQIHQLEYSHYPEVILKTLNA